MKRLSFLKAILIPTFIGTVIASDKKLLTEKNTLSIMDFGAKGDGIHDDTNAFKKYLSIHDSLTLPDKKIFKIGSIVLNGKTISGPGKIKIKTGEDCAFILEGKNNRIQNIEFVSKGRGQRPESEILLGKTLDFAIISGCIFNGNLFNAIGSNMNSETDTPYINAPWRSQIIISECKFHGDYLHHLYFHRVENLLIEKNYFKNSKQDSIRLRQWVKTINIYNNIFESIGTSTTKDSKDAIDCYWSGLELNIQGNQFSDISTHCLDIKGRSPDQSYGTSRVIISNNQIRRAGFSGILLSSGSKTNTGWKALQYVTVSQNHIEECGHSTKNSNDAAIFMRHNQEMISITGNQIFKNRHKGIMLGNFEPSAPNSKNILISGNILTDNGNYGIHISGGENVLISNNILDKNLKGIVAEGYKSFKLLNYIAINNIGDQD
ncbi:MAG: right-handed parallel beta-helix repeat-containing protein [Bacteriovoracaceae bacterium]